MKYIKFIQIILVLIFTQGCTNVIKLDSPSFELSNSTYWTKNASSIGVSSYGYKRKSGKNAFEYQGYIDIDKDNIGQRSQEEHEILIESFKSGSGDVNIQQYLNLEGNATQTKNKTEKFTIRSIGIIDPEKLRKTIDKEQSLTRKFMKDNLWRVITAVAVIFDHESNLIIESGGKLKVGVNINKSTQPKLEFEVKDKTTQKVKKIDGLIVGYEMQEMCWGENDKTLWATIIDEYGKSEKGGCPNGSIPGEKKK